MRPHRTLIFDCPYEVSRERLAKSGRELDRFEKEDRAFFDRVRNEYLSIARREPDRVRIINAAVDAHAVREQVKKALGGF